jgi:hypothetical protein
MELHISRLLFSDDVESYAAGGDIDNRSIQNLWPEKPTEYADYMLSLSGNSLAPMLCYNVHYRGVHYTVCVIHT